MRSELNNSGEFMADLRKVIKSFASGGCSAHTYSEIARAFLLGGCTKEFLVQSLGFSESTVNDIWEYLPRTRGSVPDIKEINRRKAMIEKQKSVY